MANKQIIDIDAEFEGVEFDEAAIKTATRIKKRSDNPDWHKNRNESLQRIYKTEEWQKNNNEGYKKRIANGWLEKNRAVAGKNQRTPCITPLGIFPGVREAGKYYDFVNDRKCGTTVVCRNLKKQTLGYRYISKEEYIMLTGKEL